MKTLFLIPARGGSKGLPGKNIKPLAGKPLINYAIDLARCFASDEDICVSTDSEEIVRVVNKNNLSVPFIRPTELSTDSAGSYELMLHALDYYQTLGKHYDALVLLQPTSPLRLKAHLDQAISVFTTDIEMAVSVSKSQSNPFLNLFRENESGYLEKVFKDHYTRRQDAPQTFEYNGAIYVINVDELRKKLLAEFTKVKKVIMDEFSSTDIDQQIDLAWADYLLSNQLVKLDY